MYYDLVSYEFEYHEFVSENVVTLRCIDNIDPLQPEKSKAFNFDLEMMSKDWVAKPGDQWDSFPDTMLYLSQYFLKIHLNNHLYPNTHPLAHS